MGVVYKSHDTKLNRPAAIKVLSNELADPAARRRFQTEAQTASSLNHPHILTVYDVGEHEGRQVLDHGVHRRGNAKGVGRPREAHLAAGGRAAHGRRRRARRGACSRDPASRHQARQHPDHHQRLCQARRLRPREADRERHRCDRHADRRPHQAGGDHRHHPLHVARAGVGEQTRLAQRCLLIRRCSVRDAGGPQAIRGSEQSGGPPEGDPRRAAAARRRCSAQPAFAGREGPRQGPRRAIPVDA